MTDFTQVMNMVFGGPSDESFVRAQQAGLVWLPEVGMGWYPVTSEPSPYDEAYFQKYVKYANTRLGVELLEARAALLDRHLHFPAWAELRPPLGICDVGIGSGNFCDHGDILGYDINPAAKQWLIDHDRWFDPRHNKIAVATFWDSLEHIRDPHRMLDNVREWAFVSLPIFRNGEHVLESKHFRPTEHCWYWTEHGLIWWMEQQGFECREHNQIETELGREDIHSFAFRRRSR